MNTRSYEEWHGKLRLESVGGEYSWSTYVDINELNGATAPRPSPFNPVFNVGQDGPTGQQKKINATCVNVINIEERGEGEERLKTYNSHSLGYSSFIFHQRYHCWHVFLSQAWL